MSETALMPSAIAAEAAKRRTFAIISHPDAGKTTLTEKLLLYGGAIHEAGSIKQRKAARHAVSDWLAIEKERGISVTSSVLRFENGGIKYNLLDTPGHKDFSEDTYRTLIAADTALMVIDSAKGVEDQTEKLFEVCRLRRIPVITFINKYDRPGMEPLEVMSNIENRLGIRPIPASWPIGYGPDFQGIVDLITGKVYLYTKTNHGAYQAEYDVYNSIDDAFDAIKISDAAKMALLEELDLVKDEFREMDPAKFRDGTATPAFFGSALTNFGLNVFLDHFANLAREPQPYENNAGETIPLEEPFSGFVFKLQANMNPEHRDCTAFVRVASGVFKRGMEVVEARTGKKIRMSTPHSLLGDERSLLNEAWPGDIVAIFNPGNFRIGSTLYEQKQLRYDVIPLFTPEHFMKAGTKDPFKRKQLREGLVQLAEEGVVHVFEVPGGIGNELLLGTVGALQFEVVQHRMASEYKVEIYLLAQNYTCARWLPHDDAVIAKLERAYSTHVTRDLNGHPLVLFESTYALRQAEEAVGAHNLLKYQDG